MVRVSFGVLFSFPGGDKTIGVLFCLDSSRARMHVDWEEEKMIIIDHGSENGLKVVCDECEDFSCDISSGEWSLFELAESLKNQGDTSWMQWEGRDICPECIAENEGRGRRK